MSLIKENDNKIIEFFKFIEGLIGVRITIVFVILSFFCISFFALIIPSIKVIFHKYFLITIKDSDSIIMFFSEGIILGIIFSFLLNIIISKKYYSNNIKLFVSLNKTEFVNNLIFGCITGIICSIIDFASGLVSILEIIIYQKIYIDEASPVGQFISYWNVYDNFKKPNDWLWPNYTLLTILIIIMNLIIAIFMGVIAGLLYSIFKKESMIEPSGSITNKNDEKGISSYEILFQFIIPNILKLSFVSGLIGLIYGILASVIMSKMI